MKRNILIVAVIFFTSLLGFSVFNSKKDHKDSNIYASGRIEADEIEIASKYAGRIENVLVDEGDPVEKGQVLVRIHSAELEAKLAQAKEYERYTKIMYTQYKNELELTRKEINLQIQKAKKAVELAKALLEKSRANLNKAFKDYQRAKRLFDEEAISESKLETALRNLKVAEADLKGAKERLSIAKSELELALARRLYIKIKENLLEAAKSNYERAVFKVEEIKAIIDDMTIKSPINGVVTEKLAHTYEVVNAGTPILTLADLNKVYLKVYVPERDIGKIALGMKADIYVDAFPQKPFKARVCYISNKAEFTPKEVETKKERVFHVFAIKLCPLSNPGFLLKPGMPADAVIYAVR